MTHISGIKTVADVYTLPKTNIAQKNGGFQFPVGISFSGVYFQVVC